MRRAELIQGILEVDDALRTSGVVAALRNLTTMMSLDKETSVSDQAGALLTALQQYSIRAISFSHGANAAVAIFDLDDLLNPQVWAELIKTSSPSRPNEMSYSLFTRVVDATQYLPRFASVLQPVDLETVQAEYEASDPQHASSAVVSVIVVESETLPSTPARLIAALEGIQTLYQTCAVLLGEEAGELRVIACDSGSEQAFDLLGAEKVVQSVKAVILSVWDRMIYFRESLPSERSGLIAENLPILQQVAEREQSGELAPEQATRIRHGITEGVERFLDAHAMIAEMEQAERMYYEPRRLLAPGQKLLPASSSASQGQGDGSPDGPEGSGRTGLTAEEEAMLERLLQKKAGEGKQEG
jgi:hypothetical protein